MLCGGAQAGPSNRINLADQSRQRLLSKSLGSPRTHSEFRLEQDTSTYDDYVPLKVPFTQTDSYLKLDAFLIGLKLDDWYLNSTNCLNSLVYTIDDKDYFTNNRTLYKREDETWIEPWLNFTGLIGSNFATSLPYCYQFQYSVVETETTRFESYNSYGDIMIAFLFNQMGNALEFQQKFENIKLDKESQNIQGVWMEYGDLVHIIWDFQQLEASARESLDTMLNVYFPDGQYDNSTGPVESYLFVTAMQRFADWIDTRSVQNNQTFDVQPKNTTAQPSKISKMLTQTKNAFDMPYDGQRLLYGFLNGAVDVFPYNSLPDLCRDNVTASKRTYEDLFIKGRYDRTTEQVEWITEFAQLLTTPYGISFSCLFGLKQTFVVSGKVTNQTAIEEMTEEERFANDLIVINDVITNAVFNLGYLYSDVAGYVTLDQAKLTYWASVGVYAGDFVMRFWHRQSFSSEFQFDIIGSCDTTDPNVTCLE